jgi:hypothetical protein
VKPMVLTTTPNTKPTMNLVTFSPYRGMR